MPDEIYVPYRIGHDYGIGVRLASGSARAQGVIGEVSSVGGNEGQFYLYQIQRSEDLAEQLNVSARGSAGIGIFGASAEFKFIKNCAVHAESISLIIHSELELAYGQIKAPELSTAAERLIDKPAIFDARYGDRFVRGMKKGGRFIGFLNISCRSESDRSEVASSIGSHVGLFSLEGGFNFLQEHQARISEVRVLVSWIGGSVTIVPTEVESLLACAKQWQTTMNDASAKPYLVGLAGYEIVAGPEPPNAADLQLQQDVLARCAKLRLETLDNLNLVEYVLNERHSKEYSFQNSVDLGTLGSLRTSLALDLEIIERAASYAMDHPGDAKGPESYAQDIEHRAGYALTVLPDNMPRHEGPDVYVPNFVALQGGTFPYPEANRLNADTRFKLVWNQVDAPPSLDLYRITSQSPAPGVHGIREQEVQLWYWRKQLIPGRATASAIPPINSVPEFLAAVNQLESLGYRNVAQLDGAYEASPDVLAEFLGMSKSSLGAVLARVAPRPASAAAAASSSPRPLGVLLDRIPKRRMAFASAPPSAALPPLVNMISQMRPVKDQGSRGTCVAHAAGAVFEHYLRSLSRDVDLSSQFLYWCCKQHDGYPTDQGTWIAVAMDCLLNYGCCLDATWPYNPVQTSDESQGPPPAAAVTEAVGNKIPRYNEMAPTSVMDIKAQLAAGNCVAFSIPVFNSWYANAEVTRSGEIVNPIPGEQEGGGHAMCIVGYEDMPGEFWAGGGRFYIRNSWDGNWATQSVLGSVGYGTITYSYIATYGREAFSIP